jgi:DNA modification methylase
MYGLTMGTNASLPIKMYDLSSTESASLAKLNLDQGRLDISSRSRKSRLPWRGQFSPELVEYLMSEACPHADVFYDPFCGSGTVLFEALQSSRSAFGIEVNPAAWHLAALSSFSELSAAEKTQIIVDIRRYATAVSSIGAPIDECTHPIFLALDDVATHPFIRLSLAAIVIVGMGNGSLLDAAAIARGSFVVLSVLNEFADTAGHAACFLADARNSPLPSESIDAVITSPPYINVFNYHQNYRPAAELLGWLPLQAASSEIGANRKHRQNRFLTVIQYGLDMAECLAETARLMKPNSPLVIVLGRTSNVLGASFRNGEIIAAVINTIGAFAPLKLAERSFINRFGERIYEDIIITKRGSELTELPADKLRRIGVEALMRAEGTVPDENRAALREAIHKAEKVQSSPLLTLSVPEKFNTVINRKSENHGSNTHCRTWRQTQCLVSQ